MSLRGWGRSADVLASDVAELELAALRGPRRWRSLEQLRELIEKDAPQAAQLLIDLTKALSPWMERFGASHIDGADASEAIARLAEHLAAAPDFKGAERVWRCAAGAASARYLEMLAELSQEIGPIDAELWPEFSEAAARDIKVPPSSDGHPRLAIWGPLEARLQTRDLIILGGLNEGSWPQSAPVDSFLPKRLRSEIGLPDPEERIGLSAHDFSQMACADEVVLLRAKRVDDKPAVASRWLWRLQTLAAAGLGEDALDAALAPDRDRDPRTWAAALNSVDQVEPMKPPEPRPPLDARPRKFSVSRVARLVRDPYAVYARDILKLEPLSPVGAQPGPAERGVAVHAAIERFENLDGASDLVALIGEELGAAGVPEEQVALETPLWRRASDKYLKWRADRTSMVVAAYPEVEGRIQIDLPAGHVELTGKADRIEELADGSLAIIDFKTGAPKTKKQVETGLEPQLPLEAAIASAGGFAEFNAASVSQLIYVAVSPGAHVGAAKNGAPLDLAPDEIAAATLNGVLKLVAAYDDIDQPYRSKPRVEFAWSVSDFDRLARRAEWIIDEGDE
ncbi:MAG: PD-(D/E)XK nuclease family protein [Pseudomonadota bacterium]